MSERSEKMENIEDREMLFGWSKRKGGATIYCDIDLREGVEEVDG